MDYINSLRSMEFRLPLQWFFILPVRWGWTEPVTQHSAGDPAREKTDAPSLPAGGNAISLGHLGPVPANLLAEPWYLVVRRRNGLFTLPGPVI